MFDAPDHGGPLIIDSEARSSSRHMRAETCSPLESRMVVHNRGRPKFWYQTVAKRHFSNKILRTSNPLGARYVNVGWMIDPDSMAKIGMLDHDPDIENRPKNDRPDTKRPKSGSYAHLSLLDLAQPLPQQRASIFVYTSR